MVNRYAAFFGAALFIADTALADEVEIFACQYTQASGFQWQGEHWIQGEFETRPPFFLKAKNGRLVDHPVEILGFDPGCSVNRPTENLETCHGRAGQALHFNHITFKGAAATLFGGGEGEGEVDRDSVVVTLFVCQKM